MTISQPTSTQVRLIQLNGTTVASNRFTSWSSVQVNRMFARTGTTPAQTTLTRLPSSGFPPTQTGAQSPTLLRQRMNFSTIKSWHSSPYWCQCIMIGNIIYYDFLNFLLF